MCSSCNAGQDVEVVLDKYLFHLLEHPLGSVVTRRSSELGRVVRRYWADVRLVFSY